MKKPHQIQLPNLDDYKEEFLQQGVTIPLPTVPFSKTGLLAELPPPPNGKTGWPWTVETQPSPATMPNGLPWSKISIVMPSYNQGQFIEETIRAVLLQNYPNLEFIICDGGSTDETKQVLEKYSPWLSFWQSKKDRGQGHAINLGFSIASGEYFGWINSDDFYMPGCFQRVVNHFLKFRSNFIYGDAITLYEETNKAQYLPGFLVLDRYLRFGGIIPSHAAFWKSIIHQPIWEELHCAIDAELWLRLLPYQSRSHLKFPLGIIRVHSETKTSNERNSKLWQEDYTNKIWKAYEPVRLWRLLSCEFQWIQKFYKHIRKPILKEELISFLERSDIEWH